MEQGRRPIVVGLSGGLHSFTGVSVPVSRRCGGMGAVWCEVDKKWSAISGFACDIFSGQPLHGFVGEQGCRILGLIGAIDAVTRLTVLPIASISQIGS